MLQQGDRCSPEGAVMTVYREEEGECSSEQTLSPTPAAETLRLWLSSGWERQWYSQRYSVLLGTQIVTATALWLEKSRGLHGMQ